MSDLFKDIIPSLQFTKKHCLEEEKDYNSFMVNKAMSYHDDSLFYAAEMNMMPHLPRMAQYDFYFHALKAKKRYFVKWAKPIKEDDIEIIKQYFNYNDRKAMDILNIITADQLVMIRKALTIGD